MDTIKLIKRKIYYENNIGSCRKKISL